MNTIWYVHWIELRWRILTGLAFSVAFSAFFAPNFQQVIERVQRTGQLGGFFAREPAIVQMLGPERAAVFANVVDALSLAILAIPLLLILAQDRSGNFRSTRPFVFTLPVSRSRLLQTRFLANSAAMLAILLITAALVGTWLHLRHIPVPWRDVFFTTGVAWLLRVPMLAAAEVVRAIIPPGWVAGVLYGILFFPYLAVHFFLTGVTIHATVEPNVVKLYLLSSALLSASLVWLADWIERQKEH